MSAANQPTNKLNRTEILRAVVNDAESMGIRDRKKLEQLTAQVIQRLEQQQTLPGMEHLIPKQLRQPKRQPTDAEIQYLLKEILASEPTVKEEKIITKRGLSETDSRLRKARLWGVQRYPREIDVFQRKTQVRRADHVSRHGYGGGPHRRRVPRGERHSDRYHLQ